MATAAFSARCYCGAARLSFRAQPQAATYCHCVDCRRWTGAPAPAFAAFAALDVQADYDTGEGREFVSGVRRWTCADCGSAMMATFDYLPGQIYVPLGILDQASDLAPTLHCHADSALGWVSLEDGLPCSPGSGRAALNSGSEDAGYG